MSDFFPVAESDNLPVSADLASDLVEVGSTVAAGSVAFLKFTKTGSWLFGRDDDEIDAAETLAVNPTSFKIGWQGWEDGQPKDGPIVPIGQRSSLPPESELEKLKDGDMNGWNKVLSVDFKSMTDGTALNYLTSSYGGKQAITKLMKEVGLGIQAHPEAPVAVVKLGGDSYKHAKYGQIHTPIIEIVGWADGEGKVVEKLAAA